MRRIGCMMGRNSLHAGKEDEALFPAIRHHRRGGRLTAAHGNTGDPRPRSCCVRRCQLNEVDIRRSRRVAGCAMAARRSAEPAHHGSRDHRAAICIGKRADPAWRAGSDDETLAEVGRRMEAMR
jgi:hypothetical protein